MRRICIPPAKASTCDYRPSSTEYQTPDTENTQSEEQIDQFMKPCSHTSETVVKFPASSESEPLL